MIIEHHHVIIVLDVLVTFGVNFFIKDAHVAVILLREVTTWKFVFKRVIELSGKASCLDLSESH